MSNVCDHSMIRSKTICLVLSCPRHVSISDCFITRVDKVTCLQGTRKQIIDDGALAAGRPFDRPAIPPRTAEDRSMGRMNKLSRER